jgi:hypothetical protein
VALDLSACTGIAEFDPGAADMDPGRVAAKKLIVRLVLPTAAASVKAGTISGPTFRNFTNLRNVTGAQVTGIGDYAFNECTALTSVDFPAVASIGSQAFYNTGTQILAVTLGNTVPTVGTNMFGSVTGFKTVKVLVPSAAAAGYGSSRPSIPPRTTGARAGTGRAMGPVRSTAPST